MLIAFDGDEVQIDHLREMATRIGAREIEHVLATPSRFTTTQEDMDAYVFNVLGLNDYAALAQISLFTYWRRAYAVVVKESTLKGILSLMAINGMQFSCGFDPMDGLQGALYTELDFGRYDAAIKAYVRPFNPTIGLLKHLAAVRPDFLRYCYIDIDERHLRAFAESMAG